MLLLVYGQATKIQRKPTQRKVQECAITCLSQAQLLDGGVSTTSTVQVHFQNASKLPVERHPWRSPRPQRPSATFGQELTSSYRQRLSSYSVPDTFVAMRSGSDILSIPVEYFRDIKRLAQECPYLNGEEKH